LIKSKILTGKITRYDERFLICSETEYQKMYRGHSSVQFCQGKSLIKSKIITGKITRYDECFLICSETEYQKMYRGHSSVQFCQGKSLIKSKGGFYNLNHYCSNNYMYICV